jgi:hypothetical protein
MEERGVRGGSCAGEVGSGWPVAAFAAEERRARARARGAEARAPPSQPPPRREKGAPPGKVRGE